MNTLKMFKLVQIDVLFYYTYEVYLGSLNE